MSKPRPSVRGFLMPRLVGEPTTNGGEFSVGRTFENKNAIIEELKESLSQTQMTVVIDYKGLSVAEITDLRTRLRAKGAYCKVTKNTLMRRAIEGDEKWQAMTDLLKESTALLFLQEDISGAIKAYQDFQKASKKTVLRGGVMEGRRLNEDDVKAIGNLPSKEQLMAQIAGAINGVATKLAVGINEVPSSLARALQAVSEKEDQQDAA
jgi:large subunit ribosomal protein L10